MKNWFIGAAALFLFIGCEKAPPIAGGSGAPSSSNGHLGAQASAAQANATAEPAPNALNAPNASDDFFVGSSNIDAIDEYTGGAQKGDAVPVIVAIHGLGDKPSAFAGLFRGFAPKAHIVIPAGGLPWGSGYAWWPITGTIDEKSVTRGISAATKRLAAMLPVWQKQGPLSPGKTHSKLIVTGFSQGGMLAFALATTQAEFIAESIPIAGLLPPSMIPESWPAGTPKPLLFALHGTADKRVPFEYGKKGVEGLKAIGLKAELKEYPHVGHTITEEMRRDLFNELTLAVERAN